ncbi:M20/M25/M40 family metallo-hydrolase [Amnibacterium flavum]|uniref:Acetylornithine deacetylase n=1 Tax=Amnibacterium flavum TaxID=2173173 RepID=A0A2V1HPR8_9MICO|nr:M20/M25/M40 family metallo-hydrolase [Amnibacterium flavum]PVZ94525.1 acetylornithine deacetylase [Amnibacterium flavum]
MLSDLDTAIDRHSEAAFRFLADLVSAPSTVGSEQAALEVFAGELESLGLEIERLPFPNEQLDDSRAGISPRVDTSVERYQVVARTPGEGELSLLLNGHIDVVPATATARWTSDPFEPRRADGRLYGRGTGDMKGGFAIGALALRALRDVAPDLFAGRRLGFFAAIEEECTGNGTLYAVANQGVVAPEVVLLEPTDLGLLIGGVGVLWIDIDVVGVSSHAFEADAEGNAVELAMRLVESLRDWTAGLVADFPPSLHLHDDHPYNVNLGTIAAGDWNSTSPSVATLGLRIGYPTQWTAQRAESEVRARISELTGAGTAYPAEPVVRLSGFRATGYEIDTDAPLVSDLMAAHADAHGAQPELYTLGSTTDARTYLRDFGIPAVCYGAVAHGMHGVDESVELQSIVDGARTLARFLLKRFSDEEVTA